jgi:hypothetical protein
VNAPDRLVIEGCAIATVDAAGTEYPSGYLVVEGGRILALGAGSCPDELGPAELVDGTGCLATPGLVNCHHHLYQWLTRGLAQQATLFEWLTELYPVWARLDVELEAAAAGAALAALLTSGCSTASDHHYVFPAGGGDLLAAEVEAATRLGIRFHPCRGSMDLGRSRGGLPPDEVVEDLDEVMAATEAAIDRFHDPAPEAMVRVAVAPCSPFTGTGELMRQGPSWPGAAAYACTPTWRRRSTRRRSAASGSAAPRSSTWTTSAGSATTCGWPTASTWTRAPCAASAPPARAWRTAPAPTRASAPASPRSPACWPPARRSGSASTGPPPTRPASSGPSCARRCWRRGCGAGRPP